MTAAKGFPRHSPIINPAAKEILRIVVTDDLNVQFTAPNLPPREVVKILQNMIVDLQFGVVEALYQKIEGSGPLSGVGDGNR